MGLSTPEKKRAFIEPTLTEEASLLDVTLQSGFPGCNEHSSERNPHCQ